MLDEVGDQLDLQRVIFLGKVPYAHLLTLFSMTALHIYFTTPFVLSWSMLEAMACEATVLASSTEPVVEVINDGDNGVLFDFFDEDNLLEQVDRLMEDESIRKAIGKRARQTVIENYDLQTRCLPQQVALIEGFFSCEYF
jgi:glycosyltransferase involved in cell wall biosynthesis